MSSEWPLELVRDRSEARSCVSTASLGRVLIGPELRRDDLSQRLKKRPELILELGDHQSWASLAYERFARQHKGAGEEGDSGHRTGNHVTETTLAS